MDMRFERTEKAIIDAVFRLSETKDVNNLTVTEISKEAGINRLSFYLHYENVAGLIDAIENRYVEEYINKMSPFSDFLSDPAGIINRMNSAYESHHELFAKNSDKSRLTRKGMNAIISRIISESKNSDEQFRHKVIFIENGIKGIYDNYGLDNPEVINNLSCFIKAVIDA